MKKIETMEQREKAQAFLTDYAERSEHPLFNPTEKERQIYDRTLKAVMEHNKEICETYPSLDVEVPAAEPQQEVQPEPINEPPKEPDMSGWF